MELNNLNIDDKHALKSLNSNFISNFKRDLEKSLNSKKIPVFYTVDRIEGNYAICENRNTLEVVNIPLIELPDNISPNLILKYENGIFSVDYEQTKLAKEHIKKISKNLWK